MRDLHRQLTAHYESVWQGPAVVKRWRRGPTHDLPKGFRILEVAPTKSRGFWTYTTCGMSGGIDRDAIELHLFAPAADSAHVELLTVIAHFHLTGTALGLSHTVNFGRPWLPGSACDHGLISLPYLDGPPLERFCPGENHEARCLWLIPITSGERDFKKERGVEELERRFDASGFDYLDPLRPSVV